VNVLLVEDDSALCTVISRNLRARGYAVTTADTAEGAILQMMDKWPDALVLDINLPDASGWEVLRRLSPEDREQLHVIVMSAAPVSQIRVAEFRPAHTFVKPFPIEALIRSLSDAEPAVSNNASTGREGT
jgi:two-component system OmpR family response regulator